MTSFILSLTLRQLVRRKSTLLLAGLCAIPLLVALVYRISDPELNPERWTAQVLFVGLVVTAVLPLTTLLLGTSVIGDELEDGTAVYLLTKPLPRWQILLPKLAAAWLVSTALVLGATITSGLLAFDGFDEAGVVTGFALAIAVGALAYCAVFVLLSVATNRALVAGLVYVFVWEGAVTAIFEGVRYLSIRHYILGLADLFSDTAPENFEATVAGATALIAITIVTLAAVVVAVRRLAEVEVREPA
jgi:ABC-2 type transport system permease protein